jgi:Leucine-rich repeat (LRR) protein
VPLCCATLQADLSSNMFSGPIPAVMSQSAQLVYLNVSNNQLASIESPESWSSPALMTLDASYNKIEGELL